jgi:hypothetical protein
MRRLDAGRFDVRCNALNLSPQAIRLHQPDAVGAWLASDIIADLAA